jgi:hypothetical protein
MPKVKVTLAPMPRLPKEPSPDMLRSFGPRPSFDSLPPPDPSAPPIACPSPSAYRREHPDNPPPPDYKPPSMLAEHKGVAIMLAAVCVAFAWYCWKTPQARSGVAAAPVPHAAAPATSRTAAPVHAPQTPAPSPAPRAAQREQPIYVDTVPD